MTACDFKPKSQSTDYPRPCTEEDVSVSVRDKYFNQVENFLSNFYLLSLEVVDRDMAEDFVANLFHDAGKMNFLPEFIQSDNKSEYLSPTQYLMEYDKMLQPFNRDELVFKVDNFSHEKDMYMLSMRSCYTVSDYDLTLLRDGKIIFKSRCRAWCCFPKASSYLTVKLMQVMGIKNIIPLGQGQPMTAEPQAVAETDTMTRGSTENDSVVIDTMVNAKLDSMLQDIIKNPKKGSPYEFLLRFKNKVSQDSVQTAATTTPNTINGHEYVDLGLSVKWATCNIGASAPEEPGSYFAWGETTPKDKYTKGNCLYFSSDIGNISKSSKHDAAQAAWGIGWRMPTEKELVELKDRCKWTKEVLNDMAGFRVTGPNGNSIFLPAAGSKAVWTSGFSESGYYWSGDAGKLYFGEWKDDTYWIDGLGWDYEYGAWSLNFTVEGFVSVGHGRRTGGFPIRPVADCFNDKKR